MQTRFKDGNIMVTGYLGKNAESRTVGEKNSTLTTFGIKVGDREVNGEKQPIWVNCQCWHDLARFAANLKKFDRVLIFGTIKTDEYTDKNTGEVKTSNKLECEIIIPQPKADGVTQIANRAAAEGINTKFEELEDDGDLPF